MIKKPQQPRIDLFRFLLQGLGNMGKEISPYFFNYGENIL
jgi:hypothetical protein